MASIQSIKVDGHFGDRHGPQGDSGRGLAYYGYIDGAYRAIAGLRSNRYSGNTRETFLLMQRFGVLIFTLTIPLSSWLADRYGRRISQMTVMIGVMGFGLGFGALFGSEETKHQEL